MFNELYQEILMDHYRRPRNRAELDHVPDELVHENPTCGDSIKVEIKVEDKKVTTILFHNRGCAVSTASASLMSEHLKGKTEKEVLAEIEGFLSVMRGERPAEELENFGDLVCLGGITKMPVRVKCATLAWHALRERLRERLEKKN